MFDPPESFYPYSPGTKTFGMVKLYRYNAPWGLVKVGEPLVHWRREVWSPGLGLCNITLLLPLTCSLPCPHGTEGELICVQLYFRLCMQHGHSGLPDSAQSGDKELSRPTQGNLYYITACMCGAQVALHILGLFLDGCFKFSGNRNVF